MDRIRQALDLARKQRSSASGDETGGSTQHSSPAGEAEVGLAERVAVRREFTPAPIEPFKRLPLDWRELRERRIVPPDDDRSVVHAYRMLRTQVLQRARVHNLSTLGIISAAHGEGKTLTAINLALSLAAEPNQTVLLIDLDLRRPSIGRTLGLPVERGLEAWFAGTARIEEVWYGIEGVERLFVLPTLTPVPHSSEALAHAGTRRMLADLKERDPGRLLIVDLPPALLCDDALTISPQLDAVVLVVTEGRTRREDVSRVLELFGKTRVIGTVLNRSSESERRAY
ncbi:MAG TPA: CpsD/CapB family tyrosine-protein kinase [Steroidobacteraceae bacterium]|nr:CpsD/CapB family tyrosine-protein kinase [Steroidobacteraceae bacterium]